MTGFLLQEAAVFRLDEIYRYTRDKWGDIQAEAYINGLFTAFQLIVDDKLRSRQIPADFGVHGYFCHYEHHYIYWKRLKDGNIGIVTILHERMHQIDRFKDDFVM